MSQHCYWCPFKACKICDIENPAIEQPLALFGDDE